MAFVTIPSTDYDPDSPMTTGLMGNVVGNLNDLDARIVDDIVDLDDVLTSMTPADGQVLTFDTVNKWQAETPSSALIIEPNVGAYAIVFSVYTNITVATWEAVGPTGSGAANIWTAMDIIPSAANFVICKMHFAGGAPIIYARKTGDATGVADRTRRSDSQGTLVIIPLDASNRFDAHWVDNTNSKIDFYLVGYQ